MKRRLFVTLSSTPARVGNIYPLIQSLKNQTLPPDGVKVWLCPFYKRLGLKFEKKEISSFLSNDPFVSVKLVEDHGPGTKLIPLLLEDGEKDDIIIVIDDDRILPQHFIADLVHRINKGPGAVYGYRGRILDATLIFNKSSVIGLHGLVPVDDQQVDILTGTCGIAFRRELMEVGYLTFWKETMDSMQELSGVDDILFNSFLALKNIPRVAIPLKGSFENLAKKMVVDWKRGLIPFPKFINTFYPDALWMEHSDGLKNDEAIKFFKHIWKSDRILASPLIEGEMAKNV